jgi:chromosome segregation ATPase
MLFVFAALSLAAATPDLPPAPPRVTMMTIPGRDVFALTYDVKHIDLPKSRQAEITEALQSAQLDQLLAAHLKLRTATEVAKKAGTAQDEAAKAVDREKDNMQRQQADVAKAEKQVDQAKQNLEAARRRREDAKSIDGYQATLTSMNNRVSNEQKQVSRAREILTRAEGRVKEAAQVEAQAEKARQTLANEYAKAATTAEPGLRKLRAAAGLPEPK